MSIAVFFISILWLIEVKVSRFQGSQGSSKKIKLKSLCSLCLCVTYSGARYWVLGPKKNNKNQCVSVIIRG